jgi:hypothetical protein
MGQAIAFYCPKTVKLLYSTDAFLNRDPTNFADSNYLYATKSQESFPNNEALILQMNSTLVRVNSMGNSVGITSIIELQSNLTVSSVYLFDNTTVINMSGVY